MRRVRLTFVAFAVGFGLLGVESASGESLPSGFQDEVVLETDQPGLEHPIAFKFAPDGRTFVALKGGKIAVFPAGADSSTTPTVFANLAKQVYDNGDHGLLGLELDPRFDEGRPYVYALYTFNHELGLPAGVGMPKYPSVGSGVAAYEGDSCPEENRCVVSGRLVRLTAEGNQAHQSGGEDEQTVLLEGWCQQSSSHSIGDLGFGPEGALFVSGGEGGIFTNPDYGQYENLCGDPNGIQGTSLPLNPEAEGGALRSQSIFRPGGQVLLNGTLDRVDPDTGEGWPGNPYFGDANANKRRIVAMGFRNPFRFTVDPQLGDVFVNNVGANIYEEIDRVPVGGSLYNSGWPCYEGLGRNFEFEVLGLNACKRLYVAPNSTAAPFFYYSHTAPVAPGDTCPHNAGSAISGSAFYEGSTYPARYDGALFFADSVRGCIYVMPADHDGGEASLDPSAVEPFLSDATNYPGVDVEQGPEGAIWYASLYEGTINRIAYDPGAPTAHLTTTGDPWGEVDLTVEFDASGSTGPPGDTLEYTWDLDGDGEFDDGSNSARQQFTYTDGSHNVVAAVKVKDVQTAKSSVDKLTVYPGDSPPEVTVSKPSPGQTWSVGQQLHFAGSARAEGGTGAVLPAAGLYWKTRLDHCPFKASSCHEHPIQIFPGVGEGTVGAPDHVFPSFVNFILTASDSRGLTAEASVRVAARPVRLRIASEPPGVPISVGESKIVTPGEFVAIEGSHTEVAAPETVKVGTADYTFERWCDGGARVHAVPSDADGEYVAIYSSAGVPAGSCGGGEGGGQEGGGGSGAGPRPDGATPGPAATKPPRPAAPRLRSHPPKRTRSRVARFTFGAPAARSFRCRLDRGRFAACRSPRTYRGLRPGTHALAIYSVGKSGSRSAVTIYRWRILGKSIGRSP